MKWKNWNKKNKKINYNDNFYDNIFIYNNIRLTNYITSQVKSKTILT